MIPEPPENKSIGPRDDAPHGARPGRRRRTRQPVRDDVAPDKLKARVRERKEHRPQ